MSPAFYSVIYIIGQVIIGILATALLAQAIALFRFSRHARPALQLLLEDLFERDPSKREAWEVLTGGTTFPLRQSSRAGSLGADKSKHKRAWRA